MPGSGVYTVQVENRNVLTTVCFAAKVEHVPAADFERTRLASRARAAGVTMRHTSYDTCIEGAFFHAGLKPDGQQLEPSCASGTWALLDTQGRFAGNLRLLHEHCGA